MRGGWPWVRWRRRRWARDWATFNYAYRADLGTVDQGRIRDAHLAHLSRLETERLVASLQAELDALNVRVMPVEAGHAVVLMQHEDQRLAGTGFRPLVGGGGRRGSVAGRQAGSAGARGHGAGDPRIVPADHQRRAGGSGRESGHPSVVVGGGPRADILEKFGGRPLRGFMLTQSAMARGLALRLGMAVQELPDTWTSGEATPAVTPEQLGALFQDYDMVVVYVEASPVLIEGTGGAGRPAGAAGFAGDWSVV